MRCVRREAKGEHLNLSNFMYKTRAHYVHYNILIDTLPKEILVITSNTPPNAIR